MASPSPSPAGREVRERAAPVTRRHLLTSRGSHEAPPRVVLHLPDLEALAAVALGPARPTTRRRLDEAHPAVPDPVGKLGRTEAARHDRIETARQLVKLLKVPFENLPQLATQGASLGKMLVLLQQPKMILAGVVAIGLQLAAVLAMLTGGGDKQEKSAEVAGASPPAVAASSVAGVAPGSRSDTIQTPASVFGGPLSGLALPDANAAAKSAPPPLTLPGFDGNLPAFPQTAPTQGLGQANLPAKLNPPATVAPNLTHSLPLLTGPTPAPVAAPVDVGSAKPKARLNGTIKKISSSTSTP